MNKKGLLSTAIIVILTLTLLGILVFTYKDKLIPEKEVPSLYELSDKPKPSKEAQMITQTLVAKSLRDENGDKILAEGENFKIHYAPAPDAYFVTLISTQIDKYNFYNDEVQEWFTQQGFSKDDMCKLIVIYANPPGLRILDFERKLPSCQS